MLHIFSHSEAANYEDIYNDMLRSRAYVFSDRLKWAVDVRDGKEFDNYDTIHDPLYIVVSNDEDQRHVASLRLLPTTGPHMLNTEFSHFFSEDICVQSPDIWECTRLCLHYSGKRKINAVLAIAELASALCRLTYNSGISQIIGVYNHSMKRLYSRIGWEPNTLAKSLPKYGNIECGVWDINNAVLQAVESHKQSVLIPTNARKVA
ncbi:acyl-homoserine-lactone synthase [Acetobacter pasteurianus]|uniref:acyl-homoserine-lactone synthase n=1 Tax=Acetobacter pasteurianus TaxID=438 RepID=UPI0022C4CE92|nr:acyl-homoserine-lactone synthase [Acetobacter pasteurianus]